VISNLAEDGSTRGTKLGIVSRPVKQDLSQGTDAFPDDSEARSGGKNDFFVVFKPFQNLSEFRFLRFGIMGTGSVAPSA
jgi:hypothetical protein